MFIYNLMKIFLSSLIFFMFFSNFSFADQNWIQKKDDNKWIQKKDDNKRTQKKNNKSTNWITKKNKKNDLVYIVLLPLGFSIFRIKRIYDK